MECNFETDWDKYLKFEREREFLMLEAIPDKIKAKITDVPDMIWPDNPMILDEGPNEEVFDD